ncbi:MAG: hypothetical protein R3Y59_03630 [bacterium]
MKHKKETYFWASYSDLMTSLFFIMLVMFILTIAILHKRMVEIDKIRIATQEQLNKIEEIQKATENIDAKYFRYEPNYKKHILNVTVEFFSKSSNINDITPETQESLKLAGESIKKFIEENAKEKIQYLLIIEGQASKDTYSRNYELSYERALTLKRFWEESNISFGDNCEILISGSGDGILSGTNSMRESIEKENQRFLIHIVPKFGEIINKETKSY